MMLIAPEALFILKLNFFKHLIIFKFYIEFFFKKSISITKFKIMLKHFANNYKLFSITKIACFMRIIKFD